MRDRGGVHVRIPCFHADGNTLVLPAFGSFTGLHRVRPRDGDRVFVALTDEVREVPLSSPVRSVGRPPKSQLPRDAWGRD